MINKDIMDMLQAYEFLSARNIVKSHRAFSEHYCGRSPNFLCANKGYTASAELLIHLARRLRLEGRSLIALRLVFCTFIELWREFRKPISDELAQLGE